MKDEDIEIFSAEERNEIIAHIETASARDAVTPPGIPSKEQALKRGLFPLLINTGAILLLAAGILLLFSFQQSHAAEILESGAVLGVTERALIREIRKEVNSRLLEKESAITAMNNRIADVDAELLRLGSLESLTAEQSAAMEKLKQEQEEYRGKLAELHVERAQILTRARIKEAEIREREENLYEQQGILEDLYSEDRTELENARKELSMLSGDAEKAALFERQFSGFLAIIQQQIEAHDYKTAEKTLIALKEYLATPSFSSIKSIQSRHDTDSAAVNVLSALLAEAQRSGAGSAVPFKIEDLPPVPSGAGAEAALRKQVADQAASIAEQNAALAAMDKTLEELQKNVTDLQDRNDTIQQSVAEKDRQLDNLRSQNASYAQTIETLQKTISNVNAALENQQ